MINKIIYATRYFVLLAIISLFLSNLVLLGVGTRQTYNIIFLLFDKNIQSKEIVIDFVETTDIFLLAIAFYIMSIGLYNLFIDDKIKLPIWMINDDFQDLKNKFLNVIILILVVDFLGKIVSWNGDTNILQFGISIGIVISTIAFYKKTTTKKNNLDYEKTDTIITNSKQAVSLSEAKKLDNE